MLGIEVSGDLRVSYEHARFVELPSICNAAFSVDVQCGFYRRQR